VGRQLELAARAYYYWRNMIVNGINIDCLKSGVSSVRAVSILLLEDSPTDAYLLRKKLEGVENFSFDMVCVVSLSRGLEQLENNRFDVVLFDLGLPDSLGPDSIKTLKQKAGTTPVIVLSGNEQPGVVEAAIGCGAYGFLSKHEAEAEDVAATVRAALG
jgi:DNA-binding NarL/FixJ family response regulator